MFITKIFKKEIFFILFLPIFSFSQSDTDKVKNLLKAAVVDSNNKNYADAAGKLYNAYTLSPKDTIYLYYAASTFVNGGHFERALDYYEKLIHLEFTNTKGKYKCGSKETEITNNVALISKRLGKIDRGLEILEKAKLRNPNNLNLKNIYEALKNNKDLEKIINEQELLECNYQYKHPEVLESIGTRVNGKKNGTWKFYRQKMGTEWLREVIEFDNGVKNGEYKIFHSPDYDGYYLMMGNYLNGERSGTWINYFTGQTSLSEGEKEKYIGDEESISGIANYVNGVLEGKIFLKSGPIKFSGEMRDNEPFGNWTYSYNGENGTRSAADIRDNGSIMMEINEWKTNN